MRKGLLGSVSLLLTGAGLSLAQPPATPLAPLPSSPMPLPAVRPTAAEPAGRATPATAEPGPAQPSPSAGATQSHIPDGFNELFGTDLFTGPTIAPPGRVYANTDYLFWFTRPTKLPPLALATSVQALASAQALADAQASANNSIPIAVVPAVGQPGTFVVIGDKEVDAGSRSGGRVRFGWWLDQAERLGLEVSGLYLEQIGSTYAASSDGSTYLSLPYRDATILSLSNETSLVLAAPGLSSGSTVVHTATKFWGAEADAMYNLTGGSWYRADALFGIRYLHLEEQLDQSSVSTALPDVGFVTFEGSLNFDPASVSISDSFRSTNNFLGAQVGAHVLVEKGIWSADLRASIAPGVTHQNVRINGSTSLTTPDGTTTVPGGLLTQVTNIGSTTNTKFTLVPEAGVSVGCQLTSFLRATLGYSAIYWQEGVLRPSTEVDRLVSSTLIPVFNPTPQIPPGQMPRPLPQVKAVDFWAQGVHFGLELDF